MLLQRHYRGRYASIIVVCFSAPISLYGRLALLLVVFLGISPNGAAHRLRFGSPVNL